MNSQTPKMPLLAMFYLAVFALALLLSGAFGNQRIAPQNGAKTLVYATDSLPGNPANADVEPGELAPQVPQSGKQDFFSFNFASILQWIVGITGKSLSLQTQPLPQHRLAAEPLYS